MKENNGFAIKFNPNNLLRINTYILETSKYSPDDLHMVVTLAEGSIKERINYLHGRMLAEAKREKREPPKSRPGILLARIALLGNEQSFLIPEALQSVQKLYTDPSALNGTAHEYWERLSETAFRPEIHRRGIGSVTGTSGFWLGLRDSEE